MSASNHRRSHSERLKITLIQKHNSFPLRRRPVNVFFFANAMRCFFIRSVKSGFLAALRLGKPKPFCRRCCMVRTATFSSNSGSNFFSSRAVSCGFFCTSLFIKVSVAFDVFFFRPPPNLCLGLYWEEVLWLRRSFITVDLALPLRAHISFMETLSCLPARIIAFSSLLVYFPGILKTLIPNIL